MAKIKVIENIHNGVKYHHTQYLFMCSGCGYEHAIALKSEGGNHDFNMDLDCPTISPSVLFNHNPDRICHSFVKNGMIQYLPDCWHDLKGQTVGLPEIN